MQCQDKMEGGTNMLNMGHLISFAYFMSLARPQIGVFGDKSGQLLEGF
jgi:hypothetical protein